MINSIITGLRVQFQNKQPCCLSTGIALRRYQTQRNILSYYPSSQIYQYLLRMQAQFAYTERDIEFGRTSDTPAIFYISVLDIDKQLLRIPCSKPLITVAALIDSYLAITSHHQQFQARPCFRVLNGKHAKQVASEKQSLFSLGLNFKTVCFRVEDSAHPQDDLTDVLSWINNSEILQNQQDHIELQLCLQGKKIKHAVSKKIKVVILKERLIKSLPELKGVAAESIVFYLDGTILYDGEKTLEQLNLADKEVKIFVLKKQCCFKANTQIMLSDHTYTDISKVSPGDRICTFNRKTQQLEESVVSSVYETLISESVVIKFQNGIEIETTSNHLLWCEDESFRLIKSKDPKEVSLSQAQNLKLYNGKLVEISSIEIKLIPPELFYNVISEQNKNIIIDYGLVSHHQYIKVKAPDGLIQCIDVSPSDTFGTIKQKLEKIYHLKSENQKLVCFSKAVKDEETISDKNIPNQALVYLSLLPSEKFNLVHPDTLLRAQNNEQHLIKASEVQENQEISSIDIDTLALEKEGAKVAKAATVQLSQYIAIHLVDKVLKVCPETYLLLNNKNAMLAMNFYRVYSESSARHWPQLQSIGEEALYIHKIELVKQQANFIKVSSNAPNFLANGAVLLNGVVTIIMKRQGKEEDRFNLSLPNSTTITQIKERLQKMTGSPLKGMNFIYDGRVACDENTLEEIKFSAQKVIIVREINKAHSSSVFLDQQQVENIQSKMVNIHLLTGQKYGLKYTVFKEWTIRDILRQCINIEDPAYFALFSEIIVYSHERLNKMETSTAFLQPNSTILVLKNEKISFLNALTIQSSQIHNNSCVLFQNKDILQKIPQKSRIKVEEPQKLRESFKRASSEIVNRVSQPSLKRQHFYKPFLYLTSRKYQSQISEYIRRFEQHRQEFSKDDSLFAIIKDMYYNMSLLPNHLGLCYYGLRNFKASMHFKSGNTFYWHSFTLAYKEQQNVAEELAKHSGTLFRIQSTSGKVISPFAMDPAKNQVLFPPHSYFLVENVIEGKEMDEVWLTEVTAPFTFKKNIILWVDDNPMNNLREYNTILNLKPNLQILQVTSTVAADKWIKEFGWILLWKGLEFKLISDMGRWQMRDGKKVENFQAGIDLLELMYKTKGYSARTLIFCGNRKRAEQNARKRNIPSDRYIITEMQQDLENYVGIQ